MNDALRDAFVIEMEYSIADSGIFTHIITYWTGSSEVRIIVKTGESWLRWFCQRGLERQRF